MSLLKWALIGFLVLPVAGLLSGFGGLAESVAELCPKCARGDPKVANSSQRHTPSRVCLAASAVLIVSFLTIGPALRGQTRADEHWVGAWATAATWRVEPGQPQPGQSGAAAAPAPPPA